MSTRIRYVQTEKDDIYKSMRVFTNGVKAVYVVLDKTNKRYRIIDASNNAVLVEGGQTKNFAVLKQQAKDMLEQLGIVFADENRFNGKVK